MPYIFEHLFAADESNPSNVARNGTITIFVPGDTTMTPVTGLKHIDGRPYPNPVTVNANGYAAQPVHETIDRLAWSGGGFSGVMTAYEGIKDEAVAARAAAENAAAEAAASATAEVEARIAAGEFQGAPGKDGANVLPTSEAIAQAVTTEGPAKAALSATYAGLGAVPGEWVASTMYALGATVAHKGRIWARSVAGSASETAFDATKWTFQRRITSGWGNTFVLLGNSRVALEYDLVNPGTRSFSQHGFFAWANIFMRQKCKVLNIHGVVGDRMVLDGARPGFVPRWATQVRPYLPDNVLITDAINDIVGAAVSADEVKSRYNQLIALNRSIGARTILTTTTPAAPVSATLRDTTAAVNAWLKRIEAADVLVVDLNSPIAHPTLAEWATNMSTDNIHQSRTGAARQGRALAAVLDPLIPGPDPLPIMAGDVRNCAGNPFMAGTVGAGNLPTTWTFSPGTPSLYSLIARADQKPGNWLQIDTTAGSTDTFAGSTSPLPAWVVPGTTWLQSFIELTSDAWASVAGQVTYIMEIRNASNVAVVSARGHYFQSAAQAGVGGDATSYPLENQPGVTGPAVIATAPVLVPATATQVRITFNFNAAGKLRLGRNSIIEVNAQA
jgi:lysophospholipase L1-like esterase